MSLFEKLKDGLMAGYDGAKREAIEIAHDPGKAAREAGTWVYDQALGNDIKTLRDPNASVLDKVLAGVSIASNFVGPEGKLLDKGVTLIAKEALEHGGEKLIATGASRLEETLGKDAFKALSSHADSMSKAVRSGIEVAEKIVDSLNMARNVKESLTATLEDAKATMTDTLAAIKAAPADRAAAWERVAKDVAKDVADGVALASAFGKVKTAVSPESGTLASLQHKATSTLLQDAEKFKAASGRTFVEGENLVIDVRTSKNFLSSTDATLREMSADAKSAGKHMVVFDPNISDAQAKKLLADGIAVAKTSGELTKLSIAAKAPGGMGIALLNLDKRISDNEIVAAIHDKKEKSETLTTVGNAPAFVTTGPAEVGRVHEHATQWDGKQTTFGSISWSRDGEIQQYNRGKWIKYDEAQLGGDKPMEGHVVTIRPDPAHPGHAIVSDPQQHEHDRTQQVGAQR